MRSRYWLHNMTTNRWTEVATVDEADELVRDPETIGAGDRWRLFVRYGRQSPTMVGWGVGPRAAAA